MFCVRTSNMYYANDYVRYFVHIVGISELSSNYHMHLRSDDICTLAECRTCTRPM